MPINIAPGDVHLKIVQIFLAWDDSVLMHFYSTRKSHNIYNKHYNIPLVRKQQTRV